MLDVVGTLGVDLVEAALCQAGIDALPENPPANGLEVRGAGVVESLPVALPAGAGFGVESLEEAPLTVAPLLAPAD